MICACFPNLETFDVADCVALVHAEIHEYAMLIAALPHLLDLKRKTESQ